MEPMLQLLPGLASAELLGAVDGRPQVRTAEGVRAATFVSTGPVPDWRTLTGARVLVAPLDGELLLLGVVGGVPTPAGSPRTLRITAGEELRIECGKSSIHLRADGRVEIRGEHLVSRARGANQVKGGSVHLN